MCYNFYHVLFTCAKYFAFCRSRIFVSWDIVATLRYILYVYEQCFSLSACGARQITEEWGELNINWHLVHSTSRFELSMVCHNRSTNLWHNCYPRKSERSTCSRSRSSAWGNASNKTDTISKGPIVLSTYK
jgi:hypothetical protein